MARGTVLREAARGTVARLMLRPVVAAECLQVTVPRVDSGVAQIDGDRRHVLVSKLPLDAHEVHAAPDCVDDVGVPEPARRELPKSRWEERLKEADLRSDGRHAVAGAWQEEVGFLRLRCTMSSVRLAGIV